MSSTKRCSRPRDSMALKSPLQVGLDALRGGQMLTFGNGTAAPLDSGVRLPHGLGAGVRLTYT